jgi:gliding motility-associated-like protein
MSGTCNGSKTFTLTVLPKPTINILSFPPVICNGGTSLLLATGGVTFTWTPGPINSNTIVVSPTVTTSYSVAATNLAGCSNTAVTTLTVNPTPTLSTVLSATQACAGTSLTITSSGALTYVILPGAQTSSSVTVTPTVNTTYTVTGVNQFGCSDTKTLSAIILPTPTITASSSSTLLCDGATLTLTANGANNYTWSPLGSNTNSVITTATSSVGSYTVSGESNGCVTTTIIGVQVINCNNTIFGVTKAAGLPVLLYDNLFNVSFTVTAINASTLTLSNIVLNEDLSLAFPSPATFTVLSQPSVTSQNSALSINPLFDGVSQLSLTSPSNSSMNAGKRDTIVFSVRVKPSEFYGPFKNSVIGFADFLNAFTVADSSNDGFAWDPDLDGDPTNNDVVTLITLPYSELFIPNGFSPDGDGRNDFFVIRGLNGRKAKLTIFNRWGSKVYEKNEYDNTWDALPNAGSLILGNNKVPASTYYYVLEFQDGDKETKTGFIVVQY